MEVYRHRVQYYETDKMGIVHHSNFIRWMEEARVDFLAQSGWNYDRLESMGIVSPVLAVECKYRLSVRFPELITIKVSVAKFDGLKLRINYDMLNEKGDIVCKAHSEHCFLDSDGRPIRMKNDYPEFYKSMMYYLDADDQPLG